MNAQMTLEVRTVRQPEDRYGVYVTASVYREGQDSNVASFDVPLNQFQDLTGDRHREIKPGDLFTIEIKPHKGNPNL